jgi:hypothetical protein
MLIYLIKLEKENRYDEINQMSSFDKQSLFHISQPSSDRELTCDEIDEDQTVNNRCLATKYARFLYFTFLLLMSFLLAYFNHNSIQFFSTTPRVIWRAILSEITFLRQLW